jgi:hypothetical protein
MRLFYWVEFWLGGGVLRKLFGRNQEPTFKERVICFWEWFETVADRLASEVKDKKSTALAGKISEKVDGLGPGFAWEVGPDGDATSLTVSGEGDLHRQLLTQYWVERAPKIHGWNFYPSRQPDLTRGLELVMGEKVFNGQQIWVSPEVDIEREKFHLTVWHPEWEELEDNQRWSMLFIFLDMQLGEYGTQQWIGRIEFSEGQLKEAIGLMELPRFIAEVCEREGWKASAPGERGVVYQLEPHDRFPRGDVAFGHTTHHLLVREYLEAQGKLEDPLAGTGADYVYLTIGIEHLPKGEEVSTRAVYADAVNEGLRPEGLGRELGGATGGRFGYIDLLIFDGERSLAAIERILKSRNAPEGMQLCYFAVEKAKNGRRVT